MQKFAFLTDLHFGYERKNGHKVALHDPKAWDVTLSFLSDFKPHHLILGGDILDCGAISHHNKGKPGRTEGLRLIKDAEECQESVIAPLKGIVGGASVSYILGNHEDWLKDFEEENPSVEGYFEVRDMLAIPDKWRMIDCGSHLSLGKLTFLHGDQLTGGEGVAKKAVGDYERSVRFGHFHTYRVHTKTSALDLRLGRTGIAVPCLCTKDPKYGEGRANSWVQGFNYGYIHEDGTFNDYVPIITNGRTCVNGKVYRG